MVGISVDPPSHNRPMVEKLGLPFALLSDPRGDLIKTLGLWNENEGVSEPAIVVLDGSGGVRYAYSGGGDFSDRPPNETLFELLDGIESGGEPENSEKTVSVSAEEAENETVRPEKPALPLETLKPYYLGTRFATIAMQKKLDGEARDKVDEYQGLVEEYDAAVRKTLKQKS